MDFYSRKRSTILLTYTVFLLFLMSLAGFYSIYITNSISSDAMVINKLGVIRGSMQRVAKLELNQLASENLVSQIDISIAEFKTNRIKLFDKNNAIMDAVDRVEQSWGDLKQSIYEYRKSPGEEERLNLLKFSEDSWYVANDMVFTSQSSAEEKLNQYRISFVVLFLNIGLSIVIIFLIKRYVKDALEGMVNHDSLTGIYNRRYFNESLRRELSRSQRSGSNFSLIIFDIDFFKKINDNYGHDVGDIILKELSKLVGQCVRKSDLLARIGGEEFAVIAPDTDLEGAIQLAEKVRCKVEENTFAKNLKVTVSLGVSQLQENDDDNAIFKKADNALYLAKGNGRNRTEVMMENI